MSDEDVIDILARDHQEILATLAELANSDHHGGRAELLVAMLVRHAVAEEECTYPAVRDLVPGGERIADRGASQHAQLEETMQQISTVGADDPRFSRLLQALAGQVRRHVSYDETELFPQLRRSCTRAELTWLGARAARTETPRPRRDAVDRHDALIEQLRMTLTERPANVTIE